MSSNPVLRLGIVGTGYIAGVIANALLATEGIALVAVASRSKSAAAAFASNYQNVKVFAYWQQLVAWQGLDAVYVATPAYVREEICLAGAFHHKHLLAEKPFASLASLQAITQACRANSLAFMDATHFVHHPRSHLLKQTLTARIGKLQSLRAAFFFPSPEDNNIRYQPSKEPTGVIGDMAWYCLRAMLEFMPVGSSFVCAQGFAQKQASGAVIAGTGILRFANGCTGNWAVGYNTGALLMNLELLGSLGIISFDDFVLDWAGSFPGSSSTQAAYFTQRSGISDPTQWLRVATPSQLPQSVLMLKQFLLLTQQPNADDVYTSMQRSEQTQALLDAIYAQLDFF